jgi:hypothetical protein
MMTDTQPAAPVNPYLVLGAAILLPASGHVMLGLAARGLQFLFFMVILGWVTTKFAPPGASFVGRHAGGLLIYALSVLDAYKLARVRFVKWRFACNGTGSPSDAISKGSGN